MVCSTEQRIRPQGGRKLVEEPSPDVAVGKSERFLQLHRRLELALRGELVDRLALRGIDPFSRRIVELRERPGMHAMRERRASSAAISRMAPRTCRSLAFSAW